MYYSFRVKFKGKILGYCTSANEAFNSTFPGCPKFSTKWNAVQRDVEMFDGSQWVKVEYDEI